MAEAAVGRRLALSYFAILYVRSPVALLDDSIIIRLGVGRPAGSLYQISRDGRNLMVFGRDLAENRLSVEDLGVNLGQYPKRSGHSFDANASLHRRMTHLARRVSRRLGILQVDRSLAACQVPASIAVILLAGAGNVYGLSLVVLLRHRRMLRDNR